MKKSILYKLVYETIRQQLKEADEETPQAPPTPEESGETAAETAHRLGLTYTGWGKWSDETGTPVAKTVNNKLVKITPESPTAGAPEQTPAPEQPSTIPVEEPVTTQAPTTPVAYHPENIKKLKMTIVAAFKLAQFFKDKHGPDAVKALMDSKAATTEPVKLDLLEKALKFLNGQPVETPGAIEPPMVNGSPIQVIVNGKTGVVDFADLDVKLTHITFDDGTSGVFPIDQVQVRKEGQEMEERPVTDTGIDPQTEKDMRKLFKEAGRDPYKPAGDHHMHPGWNTGMDTNDVPYDANGEATVQKLLAMVGDPLKLLRWLVKKHKEESPNGKQRILQYIGILKDMGLFNGDPENPDTEQPPDDEGYHHFAPDNY